MINPQFVMDCWPLQDVTLGESVSSYPTRSIVRLHAREGAFVIKIDTQPAAVDLAQKTLSVFPYLSAQGFTHMPMLLPARNGAPVVYTADQSSMTIMEYIAGGYPESTPATWYRLGMISAKLNSFTDFPYPYAVPVRGVIQELIEQAEQHPAKAEFLRLIDMLYPLQDYPNKGLIHGEINLRNSLLRRDGELVLIDFDECGTGPTILEAGYPLFTVFLAEDLGFQRESAASYYQAYYQQNPPGEFERDMLFRSGLLHALRYMRFYHPEPRWEKARYAAAHHEELMAAVFGE